MIKCLTKNQLQCPGFWQSRFIISVAVKRISHKVKFGDRNQAAICAVATRTFDKAKMKEWLDHK